MACLGDCWGELGPPPDSILFLPPPPLPAFLQRAPPILGGGDSGGGTTAPGNGTVPPCAAQLCDSWLYKEGGAPTKVAAGGEYVELPRQDIESTWAGSNIDNTWLLVLVASCVGVLLLGALLALFLLRCREQHRHQSKASIAAAHNHHHHHHHIGDCSAGGVVVGSGIKVAPPPPHHHHHTHHHHEAVLYPEPPPTAATNGHHHHLWAALTPRGGTQHFISENYPHDFMAPEYTRTPPDDTYESIDNFMPTPQVVAFQKVIAANEKASFDNSGFVDYDYEDPTPLIESYQLSDIDSREYNPYTEVGVGDIPVNNGGNTLRRQIRPIVSSPTRIEHPNLPPLNLNPHHRSATNTLRRGGGGTLSRRGSDCSQFGKSN